MATQIRLRSAARATRLGALSLAALTATTLLACKSEPEPGQEAFEAANAKITVYESQIGFGNTPAATQAAAKFSERLKKLDAENFSGGKDMNTLTTQGQWLSYCNVTKTTATYLVRAPNLETYKGKDREFLLGLAWQAANESSTALSPKPTTINVAIRGKLLYGGMASGAPAAKAASTQTAASIDLKPLYASFAAK